MINNNIIHNIKYINRENSNSRLVTKEGKAPFLEFEPLSKLGFITHGFATRLGGVSEGIYESMNLSFTREDDEKSVTENFRIMADALGTTPENMIYSMQTHTVNVMKADRNRAGMGILRDRDFTDIDGLVTNEAGICLVTSYADCVPLFFVDPIKKCIGLSHSGWRGTVGNMAKRTVERMTAEYGSSPNDIIGYVGPSICQECYEISEDVAEEFRKVYSDSQMKKLLKKYNNHKYQLNLHMANVYNMISANMRVCNIYVTDLCTCCNPDLLFSHRASKGQRGGLCAFLMIND